MSNSEFPDGHMGHVRIDARTVLKIWSELQHDINILGTPCVSPNANTRQQFCIAFINFISSFSIQLFIVCEDRLNGCKGPHVLHACIARQSPVSHESHGRVYSYFDSKKHTVRILLLSHWLFTTESRVTRFPGRKVLKEVSGITSVRFRGVLNVRIFSLLQNSRRRCC